MNKDDIKNAIIGILVLAGIVLFFYICFFQNSNKESKVEMTYQESLEADITELKRQNEEYEEKISQLKSKIEELEKDYEEKKDLVDLLTDQLESHGIIPNEL